MVGPWGWGRVTMGSVLNPESDRVLSPFAAARLVLRKSTVDRAHSENESPLPPPQPLRKPFSKPEALPNAQGTHEARDHFLDEAGSGDQSTISLPIRSLRRQKANRQSSPGPLRVPGRSILTLPPLTRQRSHSPHCSTARRGDPRRGKSRSILTSSEPRGSNATASGATLSSRV